MEMSRIAWINRFSAGINQHDIGQPLNRLHGLQLAVQHFFSRLELRRRGVSGKRVQHREVGFDIVKTLRYLDIGLQPGKKISDLVGLVNRDIPQLVKADALQGTPVFAGSERAQ